MSRVLPALAIILACQPTWAGHKVGMGVDNSDHSAQQELKWLIYRYEHQFGLNKKRTKQRDYYIINKKACAILSDEKYADLKWGQVNRLIDGIYYGRLNAHRKMKRQHAQIEEGEGEETTSIQDEYDEIDAQFIADLDAILQMT